MAQRLGTQLRYWRDLREMSQQQVANALERENLGVTREAVSYWEQGSRNPSLETLKALCRVFRCKLEDLTEMDSTSLVDLPSDPATKSDVDRILAAISEVRTLVLARSGT